MKRVWFLVGVLALGAVSLLGWLKWKRDEPRRSSVAALQQFVSELESNDSHLLKSLILPESFQARTSSEQLEFVKKSLRDEISLPGLQVLKSKGRFGPLQELFPSEAEAWAKQCGVTVENCVAFRLDGKDLRCEVVLFQKNNSFRVVRCNNVKPLAAAIP